MDRRDALSAVSLIVGGTIVGATNFLSGCTKSSEKSPLVLHSKEEFKLIEELAETILPKTTSSPGAKDVGIGEFIVTIVSDCYEKGEQKTILDGIINLDDISLRNYNDKFIHLSPSNKNELLLMLEEKSKTYNQNIIKGEAPHYYTMMKQLTIWGFLSSATVGTKILRHVPIPGRYDGCLPYEKGEKAWS